MTKWCVHRWHWKLKSRWSYWLEKDVNHIWFDRIATMNWLRTAVSDGGLSVRKAAEWRTSPCGWKNRQSDCEREKCEQVIGGVREKENRRKWDECKNCRKEWEWNERKTKVIKSSCVCVSSQFAFLRGQTAVRDNQLKSWLSQTITKTYDMKFTIGTSNNQHYGSVLFVSVSQKSHCKLSWLITSNHKNNRARFVIDSAERYWRVRVLIVSFPLSRRYLCGSSANSDSSPQIEMETWKN
jgi:hypothetical protein